MGEQVTMGASMRPRLFGPRKAAREGGERISAYRASMRPRLFGPRKDDADDLEMVGIAQLQ